MKESIATIARWEQEIPKFDERRPDLEGIAEQHGHTMAELEEAARSVALWGGRPGMIESVNARYGTVFAAIAAALGVEEPGREGGC